jgi:YD repeat-containing protein
MMGPVHATQLMGQVTQYGYDNNRNLVTVTDPLSRVTTNTYDPLDRLFSSVGDLFELSLLSYWESYCGFRSV